MIQQKTLTHFLLDHLRDHPQSDDLQCLIQDITLAIRQIQSLISQGALSGYLEETIQINVQGENQKKLDIVADEIFIKCCEYRGIVKAMVSEEQTDIYYPDRDFMEQSSPKNPSLLLAFDPLDGSSNININMPVGSIFSILKYAPKDEKRLPNKSDFYNAHNQIAAGFCIYGPATYLILTIGKGTYGFVLDKIQGEFILFWRNIQIPQIAHEFAINASNERFWFEPIKAYIDDCKWGQKGVRKQDFNMRWFAALVGDAYRILSRGGIFLYPKDQKIPLKEGRLRLLYECRPMAMIIEQAGGLAVTQTQRVLDIEANALHQRVPFIFGSKEEVEKVMEYYHRFE